MCGQDTPNHDGLVCHTAKPPLAATSTYGVGAVHNLYGMDDVCNAAGESIHLQPLFQSIGGMRLCLFRLVPNSSHGQNDLSFVTEILNRCLPYARQAHRGPHSLAC